MGTAILPSQSQHAFSGPQPLPSQLHANKGIVPGPQLGWLRPTPSSTPLAEMRKRLEDDGYLFVKGLIPRSDVLEMRANYFSHFTQTGLLAPGSEPVDGIYNTSEDTELHRGIGGGNPEGEDLKKALEAMSADHYLGFVKHQQMRSLVRDLMSWDKEVLLQRTMLRHNVPGLGGESTGVHYDKLFLRGGDAFFLTAWVPLGDIRCDGGGLIYLENGVELGKAIEDDFSRRAQEDGFTQAEKIFAFNRNMNKDGILSNHPKQFEEEHSHIAERMGRRDAGYRWLITNYEAGDVVFHHPCSIHASCSNKDPEGRIRLSTDLRFYDQRSFDDGTADSRWMKMWHPTDRL